MSYKTIVVHLDNSQRAHPRLEIALRLAKQFNAHLTGIFAVFTPDPRSLHVMAGTAAYYAVHEEIRAERRAALERLFHAELRRADVAGEWIAMDEPASVGVPREGRCADLIVAGQDDPKDPESYIGDFFPESLVLSCGRPVLLVPNAGNERSTGGRVLVAWDGSREATRAVHDALPFMRTAQSTTILSVNAAHKGEPDRLFGADIATVIARHGVAVKVENIETGSAGSVGEVLLSQVADSGADLLVMGAYGHARWRELVLGGATRTILRSMTVPVLMSHSIQPASFLIWSVRHVPKDSGGHRRQRNLGARAECCDRACARGGRAVGGTVCRGHTVDVLRHTQLRPVIRA